MTRWRRFAGLPRKEQMLFLRALLLLLFCRIRLRLNGVDLLRTWALRSGNGRCDLNQLVTAVDRATRVDQTSTCLARAITLQHLLSANGHMCELKIGVWQTNGQLTAHAWIEQDDVVLIGGGPDLANARVLDVWSNLPPHERTPAPGDA